MIYSKILDGVKKGRRGRHSEKLKNRHRKTTPLLCEFWLSGSVIS